MTLCTQLFHCTQLWLAVLNFTVECQHTHQLVTNDRINHIVDAIADVWLSGVGCHIQRRNELSSTHSRTEKIKNKLSILLIRRLLRRKLVERSQSADDLVTCVEDSGDSLGNSLWSSDFFHQSWATREISSIPLLIVPQNFTDSIPGAQSFQIFQQKHRNPHFVISACWIFDFFCCFRVMNHVLL